MLLKLTTPILNEDDRPFPKIPFTKEQQTKFDAGEAFDYEPFILKAVCIKALHEAPSATEKDFPSQKRFDRGFLARKLMDAKTEIELSIEDLKSIKDCVGETFVPLIVFQVWNALEGK